MSKKNLRLEILEKLSTLATAGFGLVAALAWNSAVQDLFARATFFGDEDSIAAKFVYAVGVTVVVEVITFGIGRSVNKIKGEE